MDHQKRSSPGLDLRVGARAIKRLLLGFLLACIVLSVLYASRDRLSSLTYSDLLVEDNVATTAENYADYVELHLEDIESIDPLKSITAAACDARRQHYKELMQSRSSARQLKLDEQGFLEGRSLQLASTQELLSETCYSAEERLHPLRGKIDDAVNLCNALEQPLNRTTIVLRLEIDNLFSDDAVWNLRRLIAEVGWVSGIDVNILQVRGPEYDENKVPAEFRRLLINYQVDEVFDGYPDETEAKSKIDRDGLNYRHDHGSRYATTFYQFPQVWFFEHHAYDFAYFVESHIRHISSYADIFNGLATVQEGADLLSLDPITVIRPSVLWGPKQDSLPESYYRAKFALHGISSRMAQAMKETLMQGVNAPHDGFLPAVAVKQDLNIVMYAHPIMKRQNGQLFEKYSVPGDREWPIHNVKHDPLEEGQRVVWEHGGTFAVNTAKWVLDAPTTKWIDELYQDWLHDPKICLPGLLVFPVSGR